MSTSRRVLISISLLALAALAAAARKPPRLTLQLAVLDGVHRDVLSDISPVDQGPFSIGLSSPTQEIEIVRHRLELEAAGDSLHRMRMTAEFRGSAELVADLGMPGMPSRMEDSIVIPLQETDLEGVLRLAPIEGGYQVTTVELPSHATIAVESRLGGQIVALCRRLSFIPGMGGGCDGLDRAFSTLSLPLPKPGTRFEIDAAKLAPTERSRLDAYLAATTRAGLGP